jgi:phosphate transport system permease protein
MIYFKKIYKKFIFSYEKSDLFLKIFTHFFMYLVFSCFSFFFFFILYKTFFFLIYVINNNINIFSFKWSPKNGLFGISSFIINSLIIVFLSLLIIIPLSIFTSIFIFGFVKKKWKILVINFINFLSGIPSVVFGIIGLTVIGPIFQKLGSSSNTNLITAVIILSLMTLPVTINLIITSLENVPDVYYYNSLSLGVEKLDSIFKIVYKNALIDIFNAIIFAFSKVIGETMAVIMVIGNLSSLPSFKNGIVGFFFSSIQTLAGIIGLEITETTSVYHESSLYFICAFLLFIVFFVNFLGSKLYKINYKKFFIFFQKIIFSKKGNQNKENKDQTIFFLKRKKVKNNFLYFLLFSSSLITFSFFLWLFFLILIKGLWNLNLSNFFNLSGDDAYFALILMTLFLLFSTLIIVIPISFIIAVYLNEYKKNNYFRRIIRFWFNIINATPSIIFGIFGFTFLIEYLHFSFSILTTAMILSFMLLPIVVQNFEKALKKVPNELRYASHALGLGKFKTLKHVIFPVIVTDLIFNSVMASNKIISETAPVYLTLGVNIDLPKNGFLSSGRTLTTHILLLFKEPENIVTAINNAYVCALIILVLIIFFQFLLKFFLKNNLQLKLN